MKNWFEIKNTAKSDTAEIYIFDEIGLWGITAKDFISELKQVKASNIHLHINSPGGSVFDGQAIHNAIKNNSAHVTTYVDGIAASIASVIALAGDTVFMPENALLMIHNPSGGCLGESQDMRKLADALDKIRDSIATVYMNKTGKSEEEIIEMMDAETWLTAAEALEAGFIDTVSDPVEMAANFSSEHFKNAPVRLHEAVSRFTNLNTNHSIMDKEIENKNKEIERLTNENKQLLKDAENHTSAIEAAKAEVPEATATELAEAKNQVTTLTKERDTEKTRADAAEKSVTDISATLAEAGIKAEEGKSLTSDQVRAGIDTRASAKAQQICAQQGVDYELPTQAAENAGNSEQEPNSKLEGIDQTKAIFRKQLQAIQKAQFSVSPPNS
ncbi:head maturation protease, ClpP-related [Rubellicoccus peritrichatus]|uniref:ATP-dependent Clp protease proteolytic subunit n=1 Tax=Rubellicoccus peritrichatus TaxID=3080537 RepID=A0AAQ3LBQ7_9BACT|nr:head maturation protease, ClpP-related [Puniceicoccus sp. CR14]WOO43154.1 ATP-dependent Clp protease proteolytic subunit [Puniceicoccus sp. CR14]